MTLSTRAHAGSGSCFFRVKVEEFLIESAEATLRLDEVDLQNPMAPDARSVSTSHRVVAARRDVQLEVVAGDLLVRELADEVPRVPQSSEECGYTRAVRGSASPDPQ